MSERKIADIRLLEQEGEWRSLPHSIGKVYRTDKSGQRMTARLARILRSKGFVTGNFDHLYVVLAPELDPGDVFGPRPAAMKRMVFYEVGLSVEAFNAMTAAEQEEALLDAMARVLNRVAEDEGQLRIIEETCEQLRQYGSEVEIDHLLKETKSYRVKLTYQIRPLNRKSTAIIEYIDRVNQATRRSAFLELNHYKDLYALASSLIVSGGVITIQPRTSAKAKLLTRAYTTPIEIAIEQLPIVDL